MTDLKAFTLGEEKSRDLEAKPSSTMGMMQSRKARSHCLPDSHSETPEVTLSGPGRQLRGGEGIAFFRARLLHLNDSACPLSCSW